MYFCWLIGFFVKLQVLIKCPFRELQAPSLMTIFEIFLDYLNATLWISILKSVPRRFVKKMKWTKNNENVNFSIICLSQCFILNSIDSISPLEDKEKNMSFNRICWLHFSNQQEFSITVTIMKIVTVTRIPSKFIKTG